MQAFLNKVATAVAMLVVSLALSPESMGMVSVTLAVAGFLVFLPPSVMGDILIANARRPRSTGSCCRSIAMATATGTAAIMVLAALPIALAYDEYPAAGLAALIALLAVRPLAEAVAVEPLTELRATFRYRSVAIIDGAVQLAATCLTVAMALLGAGAAALVAPQVLAAIGKAISYRSATGARAHKIRQVPKWVRMRVAREFGIAAAAQYVHNLVFALPPLALGYFAAPAETGYFGFAFMLATQGTVIIGAQLVLVLQPVFGHLRGEPERQDRAYIRVLTTVSAVAVPVALLQAALSAPLFSLLFSPRWDGALGTFVMLSVSQALYFGVSPTIALLKAQGRFRAFFSWQLIHLALAAVAYGYAAEAGGALAVAVADLAIWVLSAPAAVWMSARRCGLSPWGAILIFARPWTTAAPIAGLAWLAASALGKFGTPGNAAALLLVGPAALAASIAAIRLSHPPSYREIAPMVGRLRGALLGRLLPSAGNRPSH
jgi:O-antigen/teichoic acid export membrane protein